MAYDDVGGGIAARLWWMLDDLGHGAVAVLDGGIKAWLAAGYPLTTTRRPPTAGRSDLRDDGPDVIDRDALASRPRVDGPARRARRRALPRRGRADRSGSRAHPDRHQLPGRSDLARTAACSRRPIWRSASMSSAPIGRRPSSPRAAAASPPASPASRCASPACRTDPLRRLLLRLDAVRPRGRDRPRPRIAVRCQSARIAASRRRAGSADPGPGLAVAVGARSPQSSDAGAPRDFADEVGSSTTGTLK